MITFADLTEGQTITRSEWKEIEKNMPHCYQYYTGPIYGKDKELLPTSIASFVKDHKFIEGEEESFSKYPEKITITIKNK